MVDLAERVIELVGPHPQVRAIRLVGSRASGQNHPGSDWDFWVEAHRFGPVAAALPGLLRPLAPLAEQWDRLSDEQCWMLIVEGPAKVDLIFPDEPHAREPPWEPSRENLAALDAHFWDWILWLHGKEAGGKRDVVATELAKLHDHLLGPLGADQAPGTVVDAVARYRAARDAAERRFGRAVSRDLESAVAPAIVTGRRRTSPSR